MAAAPPLLSSTDRLLRGVQSALAELDLTGRADLQHAIGMAQMVLGHLRQRQDVTILEALYRDVVALAREGAARFGVQVDGLPDALSATGYDAALAQLTAAFDALREMISAAGRTGLVFDDPFWRAAQTLETRFFASLMPPPAAPSTAPPPITRDGFEAYLLAKFPGRFTRLTAFQRLVGGFQKETTLVDAELASGEAQAMVIRAEKHDRFVKMTASEIVHEYPIVRLMNDVGVPVAEPLWIESDDSLLGRRFMVSRRARGGNTGSAYGDSQAFPPALVRSFVATLARIHASPIDDAVRATKLGGWTGHATLASNTLAEIKAWRHQIWLDPASASPSFARLFDWLEANVPADDAPVRVLHNDYGPHNILVEQDEVTAVLDWEVPRIGDPAEDLSFFIQCAGSAIDGEAAFALYQELSGNPISRFRMAYWNVMSIAKVLVSTVSSNAMYQQTDPALIDWMQMPLYGHGAYQALAEDKIATAEALRGQ